MKTRIFLILTLVIALKSFAQIPTTDLVAWYQFNNSNTTLDQVAGSNLTQTGTAATTSTDRFGNANSALDLKGDVLHRADMPTTPEDISINFWIKTTSLGLNGQIIINDTNDDSISHFANLSSGNYSDSGYMIYIQHGLIRVKAQASTTQYYHFPGTFHYNSTLVNDGEWHHVSVTIKEDFEPSPQGYLLDLVLKIAIDGQTAAVQSTPSTFQVASNIFNNSIHSTGTFHIGNKPTAATANYYTDNIDDLLVYDRELTAAELSQIVGDGGYCTRPVFGSLVTYPTTTTSTSIAFNLPDADTYDVAYHEITDAFSNATIVSNVSNTTGGVTLNGLNANTNYAVYLRKQCVNTTPWSTPRTIRTARPNGVAKLYVDINASGAADGLSWADAFTNLDAALADALPGDEIWIASGVYNPTSRTAYYTVDKENIKIYGGFVGTETAITQRVLGSNETILSGDLNNNDANFTDLINNYGNTTRNGDNSYHIINITATGNNLVLDGLTISDAHNNLSATERGGAIVKEKTISHLSLKNCIVKDNVSRNDNAGLIAEFELNNVAGTRGKLVVENCKFINNMSRWASGIYSFVRGNTKVDINVTNTLFDGNLASDLNTTSAIGVSGSASWFRVIANGSDVNLNLTNNTYVNNKDLGTDNSLNNFTRATVAISKGVGITSTFNAVVSNAIFWNNTTVGGVTTRSITDLDKASANSLTVNNSIDQLDFNDDSITNKVDTSSANPLFTSATDYTLQAGSPAINTGDNTKIPAGITADLAGNQRIFNATVDMGAYEFGSTTLSTGNFGLVENEVKLYPNPTTSVLNIKMTNHLKQATIYSVLGRKVLETTSKTIETSNLKTGLYLIKIEDENGSVSTKRFMKK
ncbi:T9SS type A sorting domain-containing protein [Lacinutrix undariae]